MAEEQEPAKKAAKRVVKKTVVRRPVSDQSAPTMRYGRPAPKATVQRPKAPVAQVRTKARASTSSKPAATPRPPREIGKKAGVAGKAVTQSSGKAASAVAGGVKGAAGKVTTAGGSAFQKVRGVRFPRLAQTRASALVGLIVGAIAVGLAVLFSMMFSELRGTSTGGGRWGSLTFVVITFVSFALGEFLLAKMHVRQPRVTSFLAISLTLVAILAFFLEPISGVWAFLIVPLLGAATYALAHRTVHWADSSRAQPE